MTALLGVLLSFVAIFMILLILVQRGRGGGLAGALGGMGGSSAFGAKAGDVALDREFHGRPISKRMCHNPNSCGCVISCGKDVGRLQSPARGGTGEA